MRTTVEIRDEHRARLLALAARRGQKGFSDLVAEALDAYLRAEEAAAERRRAATSTLGSLSRSATDRMHRDARALRTTWR